MLIDKTFETIDKSDDWGPRFHQKFPPHRAFLPDPTFPGIAFPFRVTLAANPRTLGQSNETAIASFPQRPVRRRARR
jgi:hypothetical protein